MTTFAPATDIWTLGFDQFDRPCWQNKMTRQLYYECPGQLSTEPHPCFCHGADPNLPAGPYFTAAIRPRLEACTFRAIFPYTTKGSADDVGSFTPAADMWACGLDEFDRPCWQNKKTGKLHYDTVGGQLPAHPPKHLFVTTGREKFHTSPHFLRATAYGGAKARVDEKDQWFLQRNKRGEVYYLNTTTSQWQHETPDCLKTFARGK